MVLQMVSFVDDPFIFEVVFRVVASAVDNVSNASLFEGLLVLGHFVTAQVKESLHYFTTNASPYQVFIFFA